MKRTVERTVGRLVVDPIVCDGHGLCAELLPELIELGMRVGEIAAVSGVAPESVHAVLLGGYFGRWLTREQAWPVPLDPLALRAAGATFGAGVISFLPAHQCGVAATATVLEYMAAQSAAQCGPCVFGLRAIAH